MFDLFLEAVHQAGDKQAVILSNKQILSYNQVHELVNTWSHYFIHAGVYQDARVAVLTQHEDLHLFIHLALDQINATVVPLDIEIPSAQLERDLHTLNLQKMVIDQELCQRYTIPEALILPVPNAGIAPERFNSHLELPIIKRQAGVPNYIVASSGVSDNKKWIPIGSAGLSYWAAIEKSLLQLSPKDKILCTRSPAYDARISEYVRSIAGCSTLVLLSPTDRRNLTTILAQCEQERITCLILIASQLALPNLDELIQRLAHAGLKHLMVTGDACSLRLKRLCEQYQINLWNCYGPTEATFGMSILCVNHLEVMDEHQSPIVPIGFPNSNEIKCHLIEERLYIESPFLSEGYINNPKQTEKNFPTLLIEGRKVRVFDTENRFLVQEDKLIFKGRSTDEAHCKVSGVKVDPYALQQCLEQYNNEMQQDLLQVYVVVKPWLNNYKPFAYIVVHCEFSKPHFMSFIKKWLRKEEIPILIELKEFPRLIPSEKIDRRALIARKDLPQEFFFNEPSEQQSDRLTQIWCDVLGLTSCDPNQEFMFVGGDSFQLNRLLGEIQNHLDSTYTYQDLINLPTLTLNHIKHSLKNKSTMLPEQALVKPLFPVLVQRANYFFLPPLLGEGYFTYRELAKIFFKHYRFNIYGLSDPSITDEHLVPKSLEEAAARYAQAIKAIQPKGPYSLLGFSYGATLVYFVAKQLHAEGEVIKNLHLVDGFPPALYQKLQKKEHAALLEELVNFIITTLNNRFYHEGLKPVRLTHFDKLSPKDQINKVFDALLMKVKQKHSRSVLALARAHLLLMFNVEEPNKLPFWANLYLSTPNQTYLNVIYRIDNLIKKSIDCHSYYWNHYFAEVNLAGKRSYGTHIDLLKSNPELRTISAHLFWERSHDHLLNLQDDIYALKPFYLITQLDERYATCHVYSLHWHSARGYKNKLATWQQIMNVYVYPLYDKISIKYEGKDRLFTTKYALSFMMEHTQIEAIQQFFAGSIEQYIPDTSPKMKAQQHFAQIYTFYDQEPAKNFFINLDIYFSGEYLMGLYFHCHADYKALLKRLLIECGMEIGKFTDDTSHFYNFSHVIFEVNTPNIFQVIEQLSAHLNHFISLLMPAVQTYSQNNPSFGIVSLT